MSAGPSLGISFMGIILLIGVGVLAVGAITAVVVMLASGRGNDGRPS